MTMSEWDVWFESTLTQVRRVRPDLSQSGVSKLFVSQLLPELCEKEYASNIVGGIMAFIQHRVELAWDRIDKFPA